MSAAVGGEVRRVLICDGSVTYATGLSRLLRRDPEIEVVGVCTGAEETIARLAQVEPKPHLVTMDLELPGMSGGDAIEEIMSNRPVPILVLAGVERGSDKALASLAAGALEVLSKDALDLRDPNGVDAEAFRKRVKMLSGVRVLHHPRGGINRRRRSADGPTPPRGASVIGICASAGGPHALAAVLAEVPATFTIPILVVQHIGPGFITGFAEWLDDQVPLPVRLARPGPVAAGIWVAPDGAHLTLDRANRLVLDAHGDAGLHRPSADVLLRSVAAGAGADAVAVVLTGMGRDGAGGLAEVKRAGGLTIAQDEASSAVFGMPKAAAECGVELVLGPAPIGRRLRTLRPVSLAS